MLLSTLEVAITARDNGFISTLTRAATATDTFEARLNSSAQRMDKWGNQMTSAGRTLSTAITLPLAAIGLGSLKAASDFESSFAGVRKTVDATEAEFNALSQEFRNMAKEIPINVNELNRIGEAAGALGIKKEAILDFTETVALMSVTTDLTADAASDAFARIANIMGTASEDFSRMGSTIVGLGNAGASTESEITSFAMRIAGAGKIAGLTEANILAIGSAFSSVGVEAEAGGTAVQKVLIDITKQVAMGGDKLAKYGETAGMTASEFAEAWRTDPGAAFTAFVEGLGAAGDEALVILDELEIKDQRAIRAFLSLAGAGDLLSESIANSNKLWKENSAMQEEAAKRFDTFESKLKTAKASLIDVGISIGNILMPYVERLIVWLHDTGAPALQTFVEWFDKLPGPVKTAAVGILALLAVVGPIVMGIGMFAGAVSNLIPLLLTLRSVLMGTNARLFVSMIQGAGEALAAAGVKAGLLSIALKGLLIIGALDYIIRGARDSANAIKEAKAATESWVDSLGKGPEAVEQINAAIRVQERELEALQKFDWERIWNPGKRFEDIQSGTESLKSLKGALDDLLGPTLKLNQNAADSIDSLERQSVATNGLVGAAQALGETQAWGMTVADQAATVQETASQKVFAGLQLQEEALVDFTKAVSESYGSATSLVAAFGEASAVTSDQVMAHFEQQVLAAQAWSTNLIALGQAGIDQGLLKQLAEAGPKAAPLVQALLDAVAEGNLETINKAQQDLAMILGDTIAQINGEAPAAGAAGANVGGAFGTSLTDAVSAAKNDVGFLSDDIVSQLNNVGNTHPKPTVTVSSNAGVAIPAIQGAINSVVGKTVYVNVLYRSSGSAVAGGLSAGLAALRHTGGPIFHTGGLIRMHSGGLRSDERMIIAQAGEFMIQRSAVQALGLQAMRMINSGKLPRAQAGDGASMPVPTMRGIDSVQPIQIDVEVPISLDGKQIAYSSRKVNLKTDRRNADRR